MVFFKGSRYERVQTLQLTDDEGRVVNYKATRFIAPTPARWTHVVKGEDRLDRLAGELLRDPERFWRLCDANVVMWPDDLTQTPNQRIGVPASKERGR